MSAEDDEWDDDTAHSLREVKRRAVDAGAEPDTLEERVNEQYLLDDGDGAFQRMQRRLVEGAKEAIAAALERKLGTVLGDEAAAIARTVPVEDVLGHKQRRQR